MLINKQKQTGFTIVELLIVIIVISVLAFIVINTYSGVQQKARNSQRIAAAKEWQKVLTAYVAAYGKYPSGIIVGVNGTTGVCLGEGYPADWDSDPNNEDCVTTTNVKHPSATWNNELRKVASVLPDFNKTPIDDGSGVLALGIFVRTGTVDGMSNYPKLYYYLEGGTSQNCGLSPVVAASGLTGTGAINSNNLGSTGTVCQIKLPDPASL